MTPTLYKNLSNEISNYAFLKILVLGGENFPINCDCINKIVKTKSNIKVFNVYGVSELSCWSTYHLVNEKDLK